MIPNDRPYAGWLYLGLGYNGRTQWEMDTVEVNVGMVGPAALARQTQHAVHAVRHIDQFNGWQNQLHNELGVQLVVERKRRIWSGGQTLKWDAISHYGTSLGNVQTYLNTGIELRIGSRLPADFGTSAIRLASDSNAPTESGGQRRLSGRGVHAFVAVDARFVVHDIFLDGNTFRSSHHVTKNPFVADFTVGVAWQWDGGKITYSKCVRTKEFATQNASHSYGSIMLSLEYWAICDNIGSSIRIANRYFFSDHREDCAALYRWMRGCCACLSRMRPRLRQFPQYWIVLSVIDH